MYYKKQKQTVRPYIRNGKTVNYYQLLLEGYGFDLAYKPYHCGISIGEDEYSSNSTVYIAGGKRSGELYIVVPCASNPKFSKRVYLRRENE